MTGQMDMNYYQYKYNPYSMDAWAHMYYCLCEIAPCTKICTNAGLFLVTSNKLVLGVGSTELDGVKELGVICDDIVDNDASDPMGNTGNSDYIDR